MFATDAAAFPADVPGLLRRHLAGEGDTGTVVAAAGFNDFHRGADEAAPADDIARIAAANFAVAVVEGLIEVHVADERTGAEVSVLPSTIEGLLTQGPDRRRPPRGHLRRAAAYKAYRTHIDGTQFTLDDMSVSWRHLDDTDQSPFRQVHLYRKGMWITSSPPSLGGPKFNDLRPFDAVVRLDDGQFAACVRAAEGPEHLGLHVKRLEPPERGEYRRYAAKLAEQLRARVGTVDSAEQYTPTNFAIIDGRTTRRGERVRRPRPPAGGGEDEAATPGGKGKGKGGGRGIRDAGMPKPGRAPRFRWTLDVGTGAEQIRAIVDVGDTFTAGGRIGVRLRVLSGSDATCSAPERDTYVKLREVCVADDTSIPAALPGGDLEIEIPAFTGRRALTLTVAAPAVLRLLTLDLVRRRGTPTNGSDPT